MSIPAEAYELFAAGEISSQELLELEKFAEALEKNAAAPSLFSNPSRAALALGGLAVAAPTLAYAGSAVPRTLQATMNSMRFERNLKKTLDVNPQLGDSRDPNLRMAYKTIQTTNPEYAKDPLIAGTILDMVMNNRMDPNDPSSAPRFEPTLLSEIQKGKAKDPDATSAIGSGARAALEL
jgi:hypothetical protein